MSADLPTLKYAFASVTNDGDADVPGLTISTINADREGDRVIPEGGDFTNFLKNPVLLWAHGGWDGYASVPIGTVTSIEVLPGKSVRASWNWLDGDAFADRIKNAWNQGVVRASSIGFKPLAVTPNGMGGLDHERWELLELSLCPIPMNAECVRTLKGLLDLAPEKKPDPPAEPEEKTEPAHVEKRGRVLSAVNESRLRAAVTSLGDATRTLSEVLAQLDVVVPDEGLPPEQPTEYALRLRDEPIVLRLLMPDSEPALRLIEDKAIEPTLQIDPEDLKRVVGAAVQEHLQASIVGPVSAFLERQIDLARGRVH